MVKHRVTFTFDVCKRYVLPIELDLPDRCTRPEHVRELISAGEIDWLEEINTQHTGAEISQAGRVTDRRICKMEVEPVALPETACPECDGQGYLFPWGEDTGFACIERCDSCKQYASDAKAADALAAKLMQQFDALYCVSYVMLPGHAWADLGSTCTVVMEQQCDVQRSQCTYAPLTFDNGVALAHKLRGTEPPLAAGECACPECGSQDLLVSLSAAFTWNGASGGTCVSDLRADEFPIQNDSPVVCQQCEWVGLVADLREGEEVF